MDSSFSNALEVLTPFDSSRIGFVQDTDSVDCHFLAVNGSEGYDLGNAVQSCLLAKTEQTAWLSPPLGPWDFDRGYCSQDIPAAPGILNSDYSSTPVSPEIWPSVEAALFQPVKRVGHQSPPSQCAVGIRTPASTSTSPFSDDVNGFDAGPNLPVEMPDRVLKTENSPPEDILIRSPSPVRIPKAERHSQNIRELDSHCGSNRSIDMNLALPDGKLDEPYAKLIYKAFMSRPDHAMTLQDIYQWFRDNTSRAVSEKGGWQNSIRHNLSMNAAFKKRQRKEDGKELSSTSEDAKRPNEWVLEDWAVCYGVQSTTRYRKGNSRRRSGSRSAGQKTKRPTQHSEKRAVSGRKGGCAARDSRLRGRAFCHGRSLGQVMGFGVEQGRASPPRSNMTELYETQGLTLSQMHSATHGHAMRMHDGNRPHGASDLVPFPLIMGQHGLPQGMANMNEPRDVSGLPCCGDEILAAYATPAQSGLPFGVRDVHMGYQGEI